MHESATPTDRVTPRYLGLNEVAQDLSVHRATVERWVREKRIKSFKLGGRTLIAAADLDEFLRDNLTPA